MRVELTSVKGDLRIFRSEFGGFKDHTGSTLDWVVKNIGEMRQEMTVMRDSRMRRFHDRITRVEKKVGQPPKEYY